MFSALAVVSGNFFGSVTGGSLKYALASLSNSPFAALSAVVGGAAVTDFFFFAAGFLLPFFFLVFFLPNIASDIFGSFLNSTHIIKKNSAYRAVIIAAA